MAAIFWIALLSLLAPAQAAFANAAAPANVTVPVRPAAPTKAPVSSGAGTPGQSVAAPAVAIQAVEECDPLTRWLLGAGMCAGNFHIPLPEGAAAAKDPVVRLVGVNSIAVGSGLAKAVPSDGAMILSLRNLPPGAYSGEIVYGDSKPRARIPLAVSVRGAALWPLLVILAGILIGRLIKYMKERGNAIADARIRLDRLRARVRRLDSKGQEAAAAAIDEADMRVDAGTEAEAKTALDALDRSVVQLERLARLARAAGSSHASRIEAIRTRIGIGQLDEAEAELKTLADSLGQPAASGALVDPAHKAAGSERSERSLRAEADGVDRIGEVAEAVRRARGAFVAYAARPLLYLVLLALLVLAGLESLYVSGTAAATLGGKPLSDLLVLFGWGLAADVASRTLSDFGGPAKRTA